MGRGPIREALAEREDTPGACPIWGWSAEPRDPEANRYS